MKVVFSIKDERGLKNFVLSLKSEVSIGRSASCDLTIEDKLASNHHCSLSFKRSTPYIRDNNSKNGVYINGLRVISGKVYRQDIVMIGNSVLQVSEEKNNPDVLRKVSSLMSEQTSLTSRLELQSKKSVKLSDNKVQSRAERMKDQLSKKQKIASRKNNDYHHELPKSLIIKSYVYDLLLFTIFFTGMSVLNINFEELKAIGTSSYVKNNAYDIAIPFFISLAFLYWNNRVRSKSFGRKSVEKIYLESL